MKSFILKFILLLFSLFFISSIHAQETKIMIRAKAKDAKFIGSSIGGAEIVVKNAETQEILAKGLTTGSTGNTEIIMEKPHQRKPNLSDEETAGFLAKINLEKPTFLTIEAKAPINAKQAKVMSSTQLWAIPEKDILGDGVVLEIPGFVVDILSPQRHNIYEKKTEIEIKSNIVMMCGCPITPDGIWNADDYEVKAILSKENKTIKEIEMKYDGKPNTFSGKINENPGLYEITVFAYDANTGNTGVDKTNIIIN